MMPKSLISPLLQYYSLVASRSAAHVKPLLTNHSLLRLISVGPAKEPGTEPVAAVNSPTKSSTWEVEFGSMVEERLSHRGGEQHHPEEGKSPRPESVSVKGKRGGDAERMEQQMDRSSERTASGADPSRFQGVGGYS